MLGQAQGDPQGGKVKPTTGEVICPHFKLRVFPRNLQRHHGVILTIQFTLREGTRHTLTWIKGWLTCSMSVLVNFQVGDGPKSGIKISVASASAG